MLDLHVVETAIERCRSVVPEWRGVDRSAFTYDPPKGFSSITMVVYCSADVAPNAVLYRSLEGKENPILDFETERAVYLALADAGIAAACLHYDTTFRIEAFYQGRSLTREDLRDPSVLRGLGEQLGRFHRLEPPPIPAASFFELLGTKWGALVRSVLVDRRAEFPEREQPICEDLLAMIEPRALEMVNDFLPDEPLVFSHNDNYQGNVMRLDTGDIRLVDFEFACMNTPAFDLGNIFAETVTRHGLPEWPHVTIVDPEYTRQEVEMLVDGYLEGSPFIGNNRLAERDRLVDEALAIIPVSEYMYAMAGTCIALETTQNTRFIPYAQLRWQRFQQAHAERFGA